MGATGGGGEGRDGVGIATGTSGGGGDGASGKGGASTGASGVGATTGGAPGKHASPLLSSTSHTNPPTRNSGSASCSSAAITFSSQKQSRSFMLRMKTQHDELDASSSSESGSWPSRRPVHRLDTSAASSKHVRGSTGEGCVGVATGTGGGGS